MKKSRPEPDTLDGFEIPTQPTGELELKVAAKLDALRADGFITEKHAGLESLALMTARDLDQSRGLGAPSGRANLLRVMHEILQALPAPDASNPDAFDALIKALREPDDAVSTKA